MNATDLSEIEELAHQKEKEWKHVTSLQISTLRSALSAKEKESKEMNAKFNKLKEDFKYNLKLLQERDRELKQYDESFTKSKSLESAHIAEISDLRIKMAAIQDSLEREKAARCEMQRHYRQRLIDQQAEMEAFKCAKDAEVEETLAQLSHIRIHHERLEAQLRSEIESQRIELSSELEEALRRKDREIMEKEDKMKAEVMAHELKVKLTEKELELVKSAQEKQAETLHEVDEAGSRLRKKLQQAEWDIKDVSGIKNARILELEAQVQNLQTREKSMIEEYNHKHEELDKNMRTKQANIDAARQAFLDKERALEEDVRKLQAKVESTEHETRRALWDKNDLAKEHEVAIIALNKEIEDLKLSLKNQMKEHSTSVVAKDVEIQNFRNKENLIKSELETLRDDIDRYKKELAAAAQKENLLLQSKVQLKLDWQQRCEEVERKQYAKSEELIESLTKSRDVAVAEVRRLRREMGLDVQMEGSEDNHLKNLQLQNDHLKAVIEKMTTDMQELAAGKKRQTSFEIPDNKLGESSSTHATPEYVKSLENELTELRKLKRKFEEEKQQTQGPSKESAAKHPSLPPPNVTASFAHPDVKLHINSLNQAIGNLRAEKVDVAAQLQKTQVRLRHQESLLATRESDAKAQLAKIQELEYKLLSQTRRDEQEAESLKRRISELELLLAEARREADEYYRGGIQNNLRATELGNQLSQMTIDAVAKNAGMSGIAQAGVVNQLQSEITALRKELTKAKQALILGKSEGRPTKAAALNKQLHSKLRLAAEQISSLLQEKARLLESGNSLRAELDQYKKMHQQKSPVQESATKPGKDDVQSKGDGRQIQNKLKQMEELQYQLTRQELQYAQRISPRKYNDGLQGKFKSPQTTSTPTAGLAKTTPVADDGGQASDLTPLPVLQYSLSSVGDTDLKDVWQMLDQEPSSPSVPGSREGSVAAFRENSEKKNPTAHPGKQENPFKRAPQRGMTKTRARKIRNYNIKDDDEAKVQRQLGKR